MDVLIIVLENVCEIDLGDARVSSAGLSANEKAQNM